MGTAESGAGGRWRRQRVHSPLQRLQPWLLNMHCFCTAAHACAQRRAGGPHLCDQLAAPAPEPSGLKVGEGPGDAQLPHHLEDVVVLPPEALGARLHRPPLRRPPAGCARRGGGCRPQGASAGGCRTCAASGWPLAAKRPPSEVASVRHPSPFARRQAPHQRGRPGWGRRPAASRRSPAPPGASARRNLRHKGMVGGEQWRVLLHRDTTALVKWSTRSCAAKSSCGRPA